MEDETVLYEASVEEAIAWYLTEIDAGRRPSQQEWLAVYPAELAPALREFLAGQDEIRGLAAPLRPDDTTAMPSSFGNYERLEPISPGGMGVVYKARQLNPPRDVALKMIRAGQFATPDDLQRFRIEAESVATLDHPHIVPIYELGEYQGLPYFTMKLMEGGSLAQRMADFQLPRLGRKSRKDGSGVVWSKAKIAKRVKALTELVETVARAVHYAHQRGLLHRDLKPGNILLDGELRPNVSDFGLAKRVVDPPLAQGTPPGPTPAWPCSSPGANGLNGQLHVVTQDSAVTHLETIEGTPSYMAPEQAAGRKGLTTAVDVYGLGAILYELLVGEPPFRGTSPHDTLSQVLEKEPVAPSLSQSSVPPELEAICLKCLRKQPEQRYASADALADDLRRYLMGKPIHGRPSSLGERAMKWAKRNPGIAALTAMLLLVVGLGVGAVSWEWREEAAALEKAEKHLYIYKIARAERRLSSGQAYRAQEILEDCRADLRGWEWHYLKRWWQREVFTLRGHEDLVRSVVFRADGRIVVSSSDDKTVKVWNASTGEELLTLDRHSNAVGSLAFSGDGKFLAWAADDMTVKVWDFTQPREPRELFPPRAAGTVVALSSDGKLLAWAGRDETVTIYDLEKQSIRLRLQHQGKVLCVAFSADDKWLASGGWGEKPARVWDLASGRESASFGEAVDRVVALAFSPTNQYLAAATRNTARVWDLRTHQERHKLRGDTGLCTSVAFDQDARQLAATYDNGTVSIWDLTDGRALFSARRHSDLAASVAFSPRDSGRIAFTKGKEVAVERWKRAVVPEMPSRSLLGHSDAVRGLAFSSDGQTVVSADTRGLIKEWELGAHQESRSFKMLSAHFKTMTLSSDGQRLAGASEDGRVTVWDMGTHDKVFTFQAHPSEVNGLAFSHDGQFLASASSDRTVKVWNAITGDLINILPEFSDYATAVAFSPDDRYLASASDDGTLRIWDWKAPKEILTLEAAHGGSISSLVCLVFSPDGRRLASAGADQTVRLWDVSSGEELHRLLGHTGPVQGVAFSPDGRRIASAGHDGFVKLWDLTTGQEVLTLSGHKAEVACVAFSPNGHLLASSDLDGTVMVWDGTPPL
jgi:WD40 repeat protein/serine/threonine protein kinase